MKVKELDRVLDIMEVGCDEYCSLGNCEIAVGWNEHFDSAKDNYADLKSWGILK